MAAPGPGWNIWADDTDSLSQRDTGWIQLYCENNQEVLDTILQAYRIAELENVPAGILERN
jgi:pyruvate/2-oxoacid:ferredoxin oxidoreductase alpha subunit